MPKNHFKKSKQRGLTFWANVYMYKYDCIADIFVTAQTALYQAPKMGVLGDFGPLNVIIHHRYPQKAHPSVNPR